MGDFPCGDASLKLDYTKMAEQITLSTPLDQLAGVGPETAKRLYRLGLITVKNLIEFLPRRIEDRSRLCHIQKLVVGEAMVIRGQIERVSGRYSQRGVFIVTARMCDSSGAINAVWFNQRYLLRSLKAGQHITLFGEKRLVKTMGNPFFVKKIIEQPEIVPIYPLTGGLTQNTLAHLLGKVEPLVARIPNVIPPSIQAERQLSNRAECLMRVHYNPSAEALEEAIALLGFEELLITCLLALEAKEERRRQIGATRPISRDQLDAALLRFDFQPTAGQRLACREIADDLSRSYPMNRLLYGEVGSGKTAVGLAAALSVASTGQRVLWLSPTVTLAEQQARITSEYARQFDQQTTLITRHTSKDIGTARLVIGTHAVLRDTYDFGDVGLIVIDEQQRFGVEQRNTLLKRYPSAHLLMMSATPIPRTLAHTLFGHLDITYLRDKPRHQVEIATRVFRDASREKVEQHLAERLSAGQPGYVICPLITDPENDATLFADERKAVQSEFRRLHTIFPQARIGFIHGQLKNDQKEKVMEEFRLGRLDILVATSIIEVGIDNQAATWIVIEEADRFGLSQLHQLRGRVGRGSQLSVCFLHNSLSTDNATERLSALAKARDGLEIAELDLKLRGPGNIAGNEQSGLPNVRYADLSNLETIKAAYAAAEKIGISNLAQYPDLERELKSWQNNERAST